jgi:hypothetical protein
LGVGEGAALEDLDQLLGLSIGPTANEEGAVCRAAQEPFRGAVRPVVAL